MQLVRTQLASTPLAYVMAMLTSTAGIMAVGVSTLPSCSYGSSTRDTTEVYEFVFWFGGQGADPGEFNGPNGMGSDLCGNIYVCDSGNHRIQKFDSLGNFLMMFGEYGGGPGQFIWPRDVAVGADGASYVCDYDPYEADSSWVQKFDSLGNFVLRWGGENGHEPGQLYAPIGIASGDSGYVFVGDLGYRIQRFSSNGDFDTLWTHPDTTAHGGRVVGTYPGSVYTTWATGDDYVFRHDPVGNIILSFGGGGVVGFVHDLATDSHGNLYCGDSWNSRISKFDSLGNFVTMWGEGGPQPWPTLDIAGIAVDAHDGVYVSDFTQDRVVKYRREMVGVEAKPLRVLESRGGIGLAQNYPNPFRVQTAIRYAIGDGATEGWPERGRPGRPVSVQLEVYNLLGQRVRTLVDAVQLRGEYSVQWDGLSDEGQRLASGIYVYQLRVRAGDQMMSRRCVVIR